MPALRKALGVAVAWVALAPAVAHAQTNSPAAAQALYDEARRLVDAKDYAAACPKFKESYELDPGGGTLLNLADCYEKLGKTALAWTTFKEALVAAQRDGNAPRVEFAKTHIAALEPKLSTVTINVSTEARGSGLTVTIDGTPLGEAAWGVAVPVDPGKHVIRAEASGKKPFEQLVDVPTAGGAHEVVGLPVLAPRDASDVPPAGGAADTSGSGSSGRTIGWITAGAGVVALGVGSYFGLHAMSEWDDRNQACKAGCTPGAKESGDNASSAATLSTVFFAVGVGAVGVGTVLILTSKGATSAEHARATPSQALELSFAAAPGGGGIRLRQRW